MILDEALKEAKAEHGNLSISDKKKFILQIEQQLAQNTKIFKKKWLVVLSVLIIVPMFGSAVCATVNKWTTTWNNRIHATNSDAADSTIAYIAPFWKQGYINSLSQRTVTFIDLKTARNMADFPIREPNIVPGWSNVFSQGYVEEKDIPPKYLDVYQDANGQRISVLQQKSADLNSQKQKVPILEYPHSAQTITNFKPDLAVLVSGVIADQDQTKAYELDIYHKNSDNTVTEFEIGGTELEQTLELFAKEYLQSPTN